MKTSSTLPVAAFTLALGVVTSIELRAQDRPGAAEPYSIAGIQAKLYYAQDSTFSENVLDNRQFRLYNVIIGEGSARAPSENVLVLVEVVGRPRSRSFGRGVELTVTEQSDQRTVKLRRRSNIGLIEQSGRTFVAFWLYDTGCAPLRLRARITGQSAPSTTEKSLPFKCGE